jgi:nucleoid DNA-binding protein
MTNRAERKKRVLNLRSRKALKLPVLIDRVILETGKSREDVSLIVNCFIANLQDAITEQDVTISGFGFFWAEIRKRYFFDINAKRWKGGIDAVKSAFSVKPLVHFEPSEAFLTLVRQAKKDKIEELKKGNGNENDS